MGSRGEQAPSSTNYLKERIGQRDGLVIREKLPNFLLVYTSKKGNPTSHYWPKKVRRGCCSRVLFWRWISSYSLKTIGNRQWEDIVTKTKPIARRRRIFFRIYFNLAFFTWIWVRYGSLNGVGVPPQVLLQFWQNVENSFLAQNFLKRPIFLKSSMYECFKSLFYFVIEPPIQK